MRAKPRAASARTDPAATPEAPQASVSVDRIAQQFNYEWAVSEPVAGIDTYWWWARDIRLDPDEVIAADGEGGTWRVPFSTDGDYVVTFGTPVQVRETYVDIAEPAAAASAATARVHQRVAARGLPEPTKPDPNNPAASRPNEEESTVTPEELRASLGLDAAATDEQVRARIAELNAGDQPNPTPDEPAAPVEPSEQPAGPTPEPEPTPTVTTPEQPAAASADTVTLSRPVWEQTTQRLDTLEASAREREQAETRTRRDGLATAWVHEGRIAPAERQHYREMLDVDEQRTVALASSLTPGRIPIGERGTDTPPAAGAGPAGLGTGLFSHLDKTEA